MGRATDYFTELGVSCERQWGQFWFRRSGPTALGWIRALAGLACLGSLTSYQADLDRFFSTDGMLPLEFVRDLFPAQRSLLDHLRADHVRLLWCVSLGLAALATVGVGGRWVQAATLIATLSFFHRASLTNGPAEAIVTMLLAYLCIGRAGDAVSLSTWLRRRGGGHWNAPPPNVANTISLRLIQLHTAAIHGMMAAAQLAAAEGVWISGEGMWLVSQSSAAWFDFSGLEGEPKLIALWSHLVTAYLAAFPLLAWRRRLLPLLTGWGVLVWLSIAAATGDALFSLSMAACSLAFWYRPQSA